MKPAVIALLLISVLTALMIIWIAPAVGVHSSACERYPLSAGCRLPAAQKSRESRNGGRTTMPNHEPLVFFLALFGLYSPVAALASYLPIIQSFSHAQVLRLSIGLILNVAVFVLLAIWAGEPLLEVLGLSTAALTATGGIALAWEAVPLMTGHHAAPGSETAAHHTSTQTMPEAGAHAPGAEPVPAADTELAPAVHPEPSNARSVLFLPLTFPLTVGGTTFAFGVAASASAPGIQEKVLVSVAAVCYALVTGITLYAAGHVTRRISAEGMVLLDRIAGILLTAIAVILLVNGFTDMILARLHR